MEQAARKQIAEELYEDIPYLTRENERLLQLHRRRIMDAKPEEFILDMLNYPTNADIKGSPYRAANFDLMKNYTLFLALMNTLQDMKRSSKTLSSDINWLEQFLTENGKELVAPRQWGRGDEMLDLLLDELPRVTATGLFDPGRIVDEILMERDKCAKVWMDVMKTADQEMIDLMRHVLEEQIE